jgi:hypothetical protein
MMNEMRETWVNAVRHLGNTTYFQLLPTELLAQVEVYERQDGYRAYGTIEDVALAIDRLRMMVPNQYFPLNDGYIVITEGLPTTVGMDPPSRVGYWLHDIMVYTPARGSWTLPHLPIEGAPIRVYSPTNEHSGRSLQRSALPTYWKQYGYVLSDPVWVWNTLKSIGMHVPAAGVTSVCCTM